VLRELLDIPSAWDGEAQGQAVGRPAQLLRTALTKNRDEHAAAEARRAVSMSPPCTTTADRHLGRLVPVCAGWWRGEDPTDYQPIASTASVLTVRLVVTCGRAAVRHPLTAPGAERTHRGAATPPRPPEPCQISTMVALQILYMHGCTAVSGLAPLSTMVGLHQHARLHCRVCSGAPQHHGEAT
jgi:hypothetical protein